MLEFKAVGLSVERLMLLVRIGGSRTKAFGIQRV